MQFIKKNIFGILLAIVIMIVAKILSGYLPTLGTALLALVLGLTARQLINNFEPFKPGVVWSEKYFLETAIVFIGFGFEISKIQAIGLSPLAMIIGSIVVVILFALFLQKMFRSKQKIYWLIGAGSAICGSSAIAATSRLIESDEEETGISLTVINVLGLIGMILLPILALSLGYSNSQTGIFIGGILQSMGHVVGSGFAVNEEIGQIATVVKMARVSLLIPFLLLVYVLFRKNKSGATIKFPLFILLFIAAIILSQINLFSPVVLKTISQSGDLLLNTAMAAIGLKINIKNLWRISGNAFIAGLLIFILQILMYLAYFFFVK